ncbi:hypothetical protein MtrunA17_Chr4g0070191 [Medicago truncatula]|uniref:Transmembrane protein n=1 Tax=Medicago truncatula TaxID=3880 RepID=A0A396II41_MEDTR|nr:hypothetical protein MtrunA17_Chr4g0070191 [Medicago truncatula]
MSVGMHSYWLIGYFAGVGYFPGATVVVAEAERKLVAAAVAFVAGTGSLRLLLLLEGWSLET